MNIFYVIVIAFFPFQSFCANEKDEQLSSLEKQKATLYNVKKSRKFPFFDNDGEPTSALKNFLGMLNVEHDGTRKGIVQATQETFFKRGECHAIKTSPLYAEKSVMPCYEQLGLIREVAPLKKEYDHCIVLDGHYLPWEYRRLAYLNVLASRGITFKRLFLNDGDHPAYGSTRKEWLDDFSPLETQPKTESEMIKGLIEKMEWGERIKPYIAQRTMLTRNMNSGKRASTVTNIEDILAQLDPDVKANVLVVSDQISIGYQHDVSLMVQLGSQHYCLTFEVVGPEYPVVERDSMTKGQEFDRITRAIYQADVLHKEIQHMELGIQKAESDL